MDEIRLGTIGSGVIVHSVLKNVLRVEGIRLQAVFSRTREKAEALAGEFGGHSVYTDMDAFLRDPETNFIYIATPNLLHYEQTKRALLAGKNVICEKPFCLRAEQARELVQIAAKKDLILVEAVPTFFLPNFAVVKRELPKLGRIKLVMANYSQYSSRYDKLLQGEIPNIFNPLYGGGSLMDINYYNVYLTVALFGKPDKAVYYPNIYPELADTSGIVIMNYDGFVGELSGAKDTWGVNFFQVEGEKGYLYVINGSNGLQEVRVVTKTSDETFNEQPDPDRWYYEVKNLTELVRKNDRKTLAENLDTMTRVVEVLEQIRAEAGIRFPGDQAPGGTSILMRQ